MLSIVFVLFVVSFATFTIFVALPGGDPAQRIAGRRANAQEIAYVRRQWGLDQPFFVQYARLMERAFISGDLISYSTRANVLDDIRRRLPVTVSLAVGAALIWLSFGLLFGYLAAVHAGRALDRALAIFALVGISIPAFWLGVEARYLLAEKHRLLPDGGYVPLFHDPLGWFTHLLLPWCTLALLYIGFYSRVLRANMLEVMREPHVRTAWAKGLPRDRVLARHVLRNALIPVVTLFGLDFAAVIGGGAILVETVYDLGGLGQYAAQSITNLDLPPIIGVTLYGAFFIVLFSQLVDLAYRRLDPRIGRRAT
jgi:peptide/nickel transport system permease protein